MRLELALVLIGAAVAGTGPSRISRGDLEWLEDLPQERLEDELAAMFITGAYFNLEKAFAREGIHEQVGGSKLYRRIVITAMHTTDGRLRRKYQDLLRRDVSTAIYEDSSVRRLLREMAKSPGDVHRWADTLELLLQNQRVVREIEVGRYDKELAALVKGPELACVFYQRFINYNPSELIEMIRRDVTFVRPLIDNAGVVDKLYCSITYGRSNLLNIMVHKGIGTGFVDRLARAFVASGYWLCFGDYLTFDEVEAMVHGRDDVFGGLWKMDAADRGGMSMEGMAGIVRAGGLNELLEDLIRGLIRFNRVCLLGGLMKRLPNAARLFAGLSDAGGLDEEIGQGFEEQIMRDCTCIPSWLETVPRTRVLLSGGRWKGAISESLKRSIWDYSLSGLQLFLDGVPGAEAVFSELLGSGELDEDVAEFLDWLLSSGGICEGGDFLKILLREKKDRLINGWLQRLDEEQRLPALKMLLRAAPEISRLFKALLRDAQWRRVAKEYEKLLSENGPRDKLYALLDMLPGLDGFATRHAVKIRVALRW